MCNGAASLRQLQCLESVGGFLASGRQHLGPESWGENGGLVAGVLGAQAIDTVSQKPTLPADDRGGGRRQTLLDAVEGAPLDQEENQLCSKHTSRRAKKGLRDLSQFGTLGVGALQAIADNGSNNDRPGGRFQPPGRSGR